MSRTIPNETIFTSRYIGINIYTLLSYNTIILYSQLSHWNYVIYID